MNVFLNAQIDLNLHWDVKKKEESGDNHAAVILADACE